MGSLGARTGADFLALARPAGKSRSDHTLELESEETLTGTHEASRYYFREYIMKSFGSFGGGWDLERSVSTPSEPETGQYGECA